MVKRICFFAFGLGSVVAVLVIMTRSSGGRPEMDDASVRLDLNLASHRPDETASANSESSATDSEALPWSRFRGPNGTGISTDPNIPTEWSETKNLAWKVKLPGPGASSPILTEQYVFVTSYSGYGESARNPGDPSQLKRHLSCIDRKDGKIVWTRTIDNEQREDPYSGMGVPEHGYATNTPVTDGKSVFVFFGKSGVLAFDLEGNELWRVSVGTSSGNRRWGSASSLTLYKDLLIVNAAEESKSLVALEKSTGKEAWKSEAASLELCYATPAIVKVDESHDDLVLAVAGEVWGMNPLNGKLVWFAETALAGNLSPSVIVDDKTIFVFGGYRSTGSLALKAGGENDVTNSHVLWTSRNTSYVATPVLYGGRFYWIDDQGVFHCTDAKTGELIHKVRTPDITGGGRPVYASPVAINGKIYIQTRSSGLFVIEPSDELKIIAQNKFESDKSICNATPAVDAGQLFLRSNEYLYCVGQ